MNFSETTHLVSSQPQGTVLVMNPDNTNGGVRVVLIRQGDMWVSIGGTHQEFEQVRVVQGLMLQLHTWSFS